MAKNEHKTAQHVVIIGAGFGGVRTALGLARTTNYRITLITENDTFRYYPALYATATGHAFNESIIPLSDIFADYPQISVQHDRVESLTTKPKRLTFTSKQTLAYDFLVLALGMVTNYFGIEGLQQYSYGIKSQEEVVRLKRHLHDQLREDGQRDANYLIVGGGPTGIELAAAMTHYIDFIAKNHKARKGRSKIRIVEAMDRLLPRMKPTASNMTQKRLEELGVDVMTSSKVERETEDSLHVNGKVLKSETVIWTSGVANNPFYTANKDMFTFSPNNKIQVDDFLQAAPCVYVIGDNAFTPYSGLAQTALYDADFVVKNLRRQAEHLKPKKYRPRKPPVVLPVGPEWALTEIGPLNFGGLPGHFLRRAADLIGYSDILPLRKALKIWFNASELEEECPTCHAAIVRHHKARLREHHSSSN